MAHEARNGVTLRKCPDHLEACSMDHAYVFLKPRLRSAGVGINKSYSSVCTDLPKKLYADLAEVSFPM